MSEARRIAYGPDPSQFGELSLPARAAHAGTIVIIHGGFWRARYTLDLARALAADLVAHGFACWNVEYRRVGNGGGWPATFDDIAAAIDHLAELDVDASRTVTVGHSAGGHLAVLAAARRGRIPVVGAVAQAGVLDLDGAVRDRLGDGATIDFLDGSPDEKPDRYAAADPIRAAPLPVPVLCVHAAADDTVPINQSERYVAAATHAGGRAVLREVPGDHYTLIEPTHESWAVVRAALPDLLAGTNGTR
ncbi:MAG TPA: alpha/beta fold hydrolase [Jatrophihabitans sp.]|nr:alpha/beta fold hydrolase [Jatrophihabitans sp.]